MDQFIKQINCQELFSELMSLISSYTIANGLSYKFSRSPVFNIVSAYDNLIEIVKNKINTTNSIGVKIPKITEIGFESKNKSIFVNYGSGILIISE